MTLEPCAARCGRPGSVGNPELRATLCHPCDAAFLAWWAVEADGYFPKVATDCDEPGFVRRMFLVEPLDPEADALPRDITDN